MTPHVPLDEADTERGKGDGTENVDLIIPLSSLSPSLVGNDHHQHQHQHHHVIGIDAPASSSNNSRMYEDIDNNNNNTNMMMMMGVTEEGEEMQSLRSSTFSVVLKVFTFSNYVCPVHVKGSSIFESVERVVTRCHVFTVGTQLISPRGNFP